MTAPSKLNLDSTKIGYYKDRVDAWLRGEHIAPITVDIALTQVCNYKCSYCYGKLQKNESSKLGHMPYTVLRDFISDCKEIGVRGVSLVSDGESTCHPDYDIVISQGHRLGLDMALGSHGANFDERKLRTIIPCLTYLRFNISSGLPYAYARIHGTKPSNYYKVCGNILRAIELRNMSKSKCTIGLQMVLTPREIDGVLPLCHLALDLGVDYLLIKHCSDDEKGSLGIDYTRYESCKPVLQHAEKMSTDKTSIVVKWSKIESGNTRAYSQCYGPPFILQVSGTGVVAPCGMLFGEEYSDYHIGNIRDTRFRDMVSSTRYWSIMDKLRSKEFDARTMCGCLCLQHATNVWLDSTVKGNRPNTNLRDIPNHISFI